MADRRKRCRQKIVGATPASFSLYKNSLAYKVLNVTQGGGIGVFFYIYYKFLNGLSKKMVYLHHAKDKNNTNLSFTTDTHTKISLMRNG